MSCQEKVTNQGTHLIQCMVRSLTLTTWDRMTLHKESNQKN